jgi:hypothetical protein
VGKATKGQWSGKRGSGVTKEVAYWKGVDCISFVRNAGKLGEASRPAEGESEETSERDRETEGEVKARANGEEFVASSYIWRHYKEVKRGMT